MWAQHVFHLEIGTILKFLIRLQRITNIILIMSAKTIRPESMKLIEKMALNLTQQFAKMIFLQSTKIFIR